jgi:murein DD-endopeptidase MepM/ murein hydrolase activator NlpD
MLDTVFTDEQDLSIILSYPPEAQEIYESQAKNGKVPISDFSFSQGRVGQKYGASRPGGKLHEGIDLILPFASTLISPRSGYITKRYYDSPYGGYSLFLILDDFPSVVFKLRHLSQYWPALTVKEIEHLVSHPDYDRFRVNSGQQIGFSGNTGRARAKPGSSVLHIATYLKSSEKRINPENVIKV